MTPKTILISLIALVSVVMAYCPDFDTENPIYLDSKSVLKTTVGGIVMFKSFRENKIWIPLKDSAHGDSDI
jgi:hypothetical protein